MDTFLHIIFVLVCLFLIAVVLLQSGKGGGLGSIGGGGGGGSNTVFGGAGAGNFLSRMTAVCAALFMILSAVLAYRSSTGDEAVDRAIDQKIAEEAGPEMQEPVNAPQANDESDPTETTEGLELDDEEPGAASETELDEPVAAEEERPAETPSPQ